jgi:Uma2 family endonuclease
MATTLVGALAESLVSLGEYLHTDYEPDAEYVDGVIEERNVGEYDHSRWQDALLAWFRAKGREWNVRALAELRVRVSATRYRVPDVVVFRRDQPIEQILTRTPIAVFEVLSPDDRMSRILVKLADYERMGIRTILVIDPKTRSFYQYAKGNLDLCPSTLVALAGSDAVVDWTEVTELFND